MIGEETGTARGKMPEEYPSTKTGRSSLFTAAHKSTIVIHTTNIARSPYIAFGSLMIVLAVPPPEALLPLPHTGCFVAHKQPAIIGMYPCVEVLKVFRWRWAAMTPPSKVCVVPFALEAKHRAPHTHISSTTTHRDRKVGHVPGPVSNPDT